MDIENTIIALLILGTVFAGIAVITSDNTHSIPKTNPSIVYSFPSEETKTNYTFLPEGYSLVTNQYGEYRAIEDLTKIIITPYPSDDGSRQSAINRAWALYNFMHPAKDETIWTEAE